MCSPNDAHQPPDDWGEGLNNLISNWKQPMPLPVKAAKLTRNLSLRLLKRSQCCGHHGEPGC